MRSVAVSVKGNRQDWTNATHVSNDAEGAGYHPTAFLHANDEVYTRLVDKALENHARTSSRNDAERALGAIQTAATFACAYHTGRFADATLENALLAISKRWCPQPSKPIRTTAKGGQRHVLHVATQLSFIGGHARTVARWIEADRGSRHSIAVTSTTGELSNTLAEAARHSGGTVHQLDRSDTLLARSDQLRRVALDGVDLIVLHHDGHDVIPIVALAHSELPPLAILNHADHQFWLGSSVCDLLVNLRPCSFAAMQRRQIGKAALLPVPLDDLGTPGARARARKSLGCRDQDVVLLSIARGLKFRPSGRFNFLATAGDILARLPKARLYLVGATLADLSPFLRGPPHERIHFVGPVDDPQNYRDAADIYLETFPFGSQTSLLEAALAGLPVVRACAPLTPLLAADDEAINGLVAPPPDEQAYVGQVLALAEDARARHQLGRELRRTTKSLHTGTGWSASLQNLYATTDGLAHCPHDLVVEAPGRDGEDAALALWQASGDGRGAWSPLPSNDELAAVRHGAHVARFAGDTSRARRKAWQGLWMSPLDWTSWRLLAVTLLGRSAAALRNRFAGRSDHGRR